LLSLLSRTAPCGEFIWCLLYTPQQAQRRVARPNVAIKITCTSTRSNEHLLHPTTRLWRLLVPRDRSEHRILIRAQPRSQYHRFKVNVCQAETSFLSRVVRLPPFEHRAIGSDLPLGFSSRCRCKLKERQMPQCTVKSARIVVHPPSFDLGAAILD